MDNNVDVSIIIVNYNTAKLVVDCINSIKDKTLGISYEVIVVDNDSVDGSQEIIPKEFPWIKFIESGENLGFGRANNLGYEHSIGKYIFLLNSDTILINNAIKELVKILEFNDTICIVGGQLYNINKEETLSYSHFLPSILSEIDICLGSPINKIYDKIRRKSLLRNNYFKVAYICGADMMFRRETVERLGLFDKNFFMYYEETDLTKRFEEEGKSVCTPNAKIIHLEGKSSLLKFQREKMFMESRKYYFSKYHSKCYNKLLNAIFMMTRRIKLYYNNFRGDVFSVERDKMHLQILNEI